MTNVFSDSLERRARLAELDERSKNRRVFVYASDVLARHSTESNPLRVQPNVIVHGILSKKFLADELPRDAEHEELRAAYLPEQADFVAEHSGKAPFCEALGNQACVGAACPFFISPEESGTGQFLCGEWKAAFAPDPAAVPEQYQAPF